MTKNKYLTTYKFETFEIIQNIIFEKIYSDTIIKCIIKLLGKIDTEQFKKAVQIVIDKNSIISCQLCEKFFTAKWKFQKRSIEDFVKIFKCEDENNDEIINEYLYKKFNLKEGPLARFIVVQYPKHDVVLITISHCACDGNDFKELIYMLCDVYSSSESADKYPPIEDRSLNQYFNSFSLKEKFGILTSKINTFENINFKLEGDATRPFMVKRNISQENFKKLKTYSKEKSVTVNDIILTGFYRAAHSVINKTINLSCAINLRNFIKSGKSKGLTNLVFNINFGIGKELGNTFEETLEKVSNRMTKEKTSPNFSKILYLLDILNKILPYRLLKFIISRNMDLLPINYSNIGIIDKSKIYFKEVKPFHAHMIGSAIYSPCNELSISTFDNIITLSFSNYGSPNDEKLYNEILEKTINEILSVCKIW